MFAVGVVSEAIIHKTVSLAKSSSLFVGADPYPKEPYLKHKGNPSSSLSPEKGGSLAWGLCDRDPNLPQPGPAIGPRLSDESTASSGSSKASSKGRAVGGLGGSSFGKETPFVTG